MRRTYLTVRRVVSTALIERPRGVETARRVDLAQLALADPNRVSYEPSGWLDLRRILRPGDVGPGDVFLDLGSGKGRVVLAAARYPFKRVIGVEISEHLNAIARANVDGMSSSLRSSELELVTADVLAYRIPDDVTVVYLYNPFRGEVLQHVIDQLIKSVDRHPRTLRLIYRTPLEEWRLIRTGRFRLVRVARGLRPGRAWSSKMSIRMYEVSPAGPSSTTPP